MISQGTARTRMFTSRSNYCSRREKEMVGSAMGHRSHKAIISLLGFPLGKIGRLGYTQIQIHKQKDTQIRHECSMISY